MSLSPDSLDGLGSNARLCSLLKLGFLNAGFAMFIMEDCLLDLRYEVFSVGLVFLVVDRLLQVADAGILGGGIGSRFLGSVVAASGGGWGLEALRCRGTTILLRTEDPDVLLLSASDGVESWLTVSALEDKADD